MHSLLAAHRATFLYARFFGGALLHARFRLGLLFSPEDEGDMFLQKGKQLPKYNSSFSREFAKTEFLGRFRAHSRFSVYISVLPSHSSLTRVYFWD
jgi:hypothetical protein